MRLQLCLESRLPRSMWRTSSHCCVLSCWKHRDTTTATISRHNLGLFPKKEGAARTETRGEKENHRNRKMDQAPDAAAFDAALREEDIAMLTRLQEEGRAKQAKPHQNKIQHKHRSREARVKLSDVTGTATEQGAIAVCWLTPLCNHTETKHLHAYIHTDTGTQRHAHTNTYTDAQSHAHTHTHTDRRTVARTHAHTRMHTNAHTHACSIKGVKGCREQEQPRGCTCCSG